MAETKTNTTETTTDNTTKTEQTITKKDNISYKTVTYLGSKRKSLHFTGLEVDNQSYGDVIITTTSVLGSKLHSYVLEHEGAITTENVGEDTLSLQGQSLDLVLKDSLYRYFDDVAIREGYQSSYDLLSYINSEDSDKKKVAVKYSKWRENAISTFNDLTALETKPDDYGIDYIVKEIGAFSSTSQNKVEKTEEKIIDTEQRINEIKDELLTAILLGDTDLQNELKEQYTALLAEDDTEDSTDTEEVENGNQE